VLLGLLAVFAIAAHVEDAAVHFGVQSLDPAVEHLRKSGEVGDLAHRQPGVAQGTGGASGGNQFDAMAREALREIHDAGLVRHAQQSAGNFLITAQQNDSL